MSALALILAMAMVLAISVVTAMVKTIASVPTIVTTIVPGAVATSGALATSAIVLGRGLEGRGLLFFVLLLLLDLLESSSADVGRVIGRESGDQLAGVLRDLVVRLGVLLLPSASAGQEGGLVELHGRRDRELEAEVTVGDEAEAGGIAAGFLLFPWRKRIAASPINLSPCISSR